MHGMKHWLCFPRGNIISALVASDDFSTFSERGENENCYF